MTSGTKNSAVPPCLFPIPEIPSDSNKSYPLTREHEFHYSPQLSQNQLRNQTLN